MEREKRRYFLPSTWRRHIPHRCHSCLCSQSRWQCWIWCEASVSCQPGCSPCRLKKDREWRLYNLLNIWTYICSKDSPRNHNICRQSTTLFCWCTQFAWGSTVSSSLFCEAAARVFVSAWQWRQCYLPLEESAAIICITAILAKRPISCLEPAVKTQLHSCNTVLHAGYKEYSFKKRTLGK